MLDLLTDLKAIIVMFGGCIMWGVISYLKLQKARDERKKAEIDLAEAIEGKDKREEDKWIKVRAEGAFPYVMGWINEQQQDLHGQKELSFSYLRDFLPDEDRRVLEICWERVKTLDGISYDNERNIYILRR